MEALGDAFVQVRIRVAKDDPDRPFELSEFRKCSCARPNSAQQVFVQTKEGGTGAWRGIELPVKQWHELVSDLRVSEESTNLPLIHATEDPVTKHLRHGPRDVSDHGCRKQPNRFRRAKRRHCTVVRVQQHQPRHAIGVGERPVDRRRTRGVVRDKDYLLKAQLGDDGIQVIDLTRRGVRKAKGFVRTTPPQKVEGNDPTRWREIRKQTVVEMQIVREPMHQNDRRFLARVFADLDSILIPPYETLSGSPSLPPEGIHPHQLENGRRRVSAFIDSSPTSFESSLRQEWLDVRASGRHSGALGPDCDGHFRRASSAAGLGRHVSTIRAKPTPRANTPAAPAAALSSMLVEDAPDDDAQQFAHIYG